MLNVEVFLQGIFAPLLFIFVGSLVAPSYKMKIAFFLVCLFIVLNITAHFIDPGDRNYQWTNVLAEFLGVLGGLILVWLKRVTSNVS